jgi:hypothetical protein
MTYPGAELRRRNKALSAGWSEPKIAHRPRNDVQVEQGAFSREGLAAPPAKTAPLFSFAVG